MKRSLPVIFLILLSSAIFAQSFSLTDDEQNDITNSTFSLSTPDSQAALDAYVFVTNNSAGSKDVKARKIYIDIVDGSTNMFCWGGMCYPAVIFESPGSYAIGAGETTQDPNELHATYNPSGNIGTSIIRYVVFDMANPDDSAYVDIYYEVGVGIEDEEITQNFISALYPNPANDQVSFNYELLDNADSYAIIYDIVGKEIVRLNMEEREGTVRINTSSLITGFYYCSFFINDENVRTSRLMISR